MRGIIYGHADREGLDVRIANLLLGTMFAIAVIALLMGDSSMMDRSPLLFGFMVLFSVFFAARHFTSAVMVHRDMKREESGEPPIIRRCPECGSRIGEGDEFCAVCGRMLA